MFVYKKLKPSDVSITPFEAHKQYVYDSSSAASSGISFYATSWTSQSKHIYSDNNMLGDFYSKRKYFQFEKSFYRNFILNHSNLIPETNYIKQERRVYDKLNILSIPQNQFGSEIQPTTLKVTGSWGGAQSPIQVEFVDDGEGNIYPTTYTLGETNWPSEKNRLIYIAPTDGYKRKDLTVDNNTGLLLVNDVPTSFTEKELYDDSYFCNKVDYNKVQFKGESPLTFLDLNESGHLKIPHNENYNFGPDDDFAISFYYQIKQTDIDNVDGTADQEQYYLISKADKKTIVGSPYEGQSEIYPTSATGNMQFTDVDIDSGYPFKLYYQNTSTDTGSLVFERSNGQKMVSVTRDLFYSDSTVGDKIHICALKNGNDLELFKNGEKIGETVTDINTDITCKDLSTKNLANLYIGSKGGDSKYSKGSFSQIMVWNQSLTPTQIQNISESITGTPYIGNVFYSEGFVTITHPSYNKIFNPYNSASQALTLNPTYGTIDNHDFFKVEGVYAPGKSWNIDSGTFYNERVLFQGLNPKEVNVGGSTQTGSVTADKQWFQFDPILDVELAPDIILKPINQEADRYDYMTASHFDTASTSIQPFTPSNTDTIITNFSASIRNVGLASSGPDYAFIEAVGNLSSSLQTVLIASNSTDITTDNFTGSNTIIADTVFRTASYLTYDSVGAGMVNHTADRSVLMISGGIANGTYFKGMLLGFGGAGTQHITTNEDFRIITFPNGGYNYSENYPHQGGTNPGAFTLPADVESGVTFDGSTLNHKIIFDIDPGESVTFEVALQVANVTGIQGSTARIYLQLLKNGSQVAGNYFPTDELENDYYSAGAIWNITETQRVITTSHTINDSSISANDEFQLRIKLTDLGAGSAADTISYSIGTRALKVKLADEDHVYGYKNLPIISHLNTGSAGIKSNTIYKYNIKSLVTRPLVYPHIHAPWTNSDVEGPNIVGMHQDLNGNELGLQVVLKQGSNVLTSSFYASASGDTLLKPFDYEHFTGDNTEDIELFVYPSIGPVGGEVGVPAYIPASASYYLGYYVTDNTENYFTITEKSGSNTLELNTELGSEFAEPHRNPEINFNNGIGLDTSSLTTATIESISGNEIVVSDSYFITSSVAMSATHSEGTFLSASVEIEIDKDGLYTLDNLFLGSGSPSSYWDSTTDFVTEYYVYHSENLTGPSASRSYNPANFLSTLSSGVPRVRIFNDTTLIHTVTGSQTTGYANGGGNIETAENLLALVAGATNFYPPVYNKLHDTSRGRLSIADQELLFIESSSTLRVEIDVVEENSTEVAITSSKGEGFSIDNFVVSAITSSTTMSLASNSPSSIPEEVQFIQFTSPHTSVGDANFPFTTGDITASVTFIDSNTVHINAGDVGDLFTTSSINPVLARVTSSEAQLSLTWPSFVKSGSIVGFDLNDYPTDYVATTGSALSDNEGLMWFITDDSNNIIMSSSFIDSASQVLEPINKFRYVPQDVFTSEFGISEDQNLFLTLKTVDSGGNAIPVSWSILLDSRFTAADDELLMSSYPYWFEQSASFTSREIDASEAANLTDANYFRISSSEVNTGNININTLGLLNTGIILTEGNLDLLDNGKYVVNLSGNLDEPLFIRNVKSSITGGKATTNYYLNSTTQSFTTNLPDDGGFVQGSFIFGNQIYNVLSASSDTVFLDGAFTATSEDDLGVTLNYNKIIEPDYNIEFKNTHLIFEHEYQCSVDEDEYNFTRNITARKFKTENSSQLDDCTTASLDNSQIKLFKPYVTTVGLYDDEYNLLAVGKFAQPIKMSEETDMTFVIRYDT